MSPSFRRCIARISRIGAVAMGSIVSAGIVLLSGTTSATAAECGSTSPKQQVANAQVVFQGVVTGITAPTPDPNGIASSAAPESVSFRVTRVYKGSVGSTAVVQTPATSTSGGYPVVNGQAYTVFAQRGPTGVLTTGLCSGNVLGAINPTLYGFGSVKAVTVPSTGSSGGTVIPGIALAALGLLIATGGVVGKRTRGQGFPTQRAL